MSYPEHEKLKAVKNDSQAIGEFIEWLGRHGYHICERRDAEIKSNRVKNAFKPSGRTLEDMGDAFAAVIESIADNACLYWPTMKRLPNALLAEYFKIDEMKLDDEKRAMLERLRSSSPRKVSNA